MKKVYKVNRMELALILMMSQTVKMMTRTNHSQTITKTGLKLREQKHRIKATRKMKKMMKR